MFATDMTSPLSTASAAGRDASTSEGCDRALTFSIGPQSRPLTGPS